jgi:hypothetical protein
MSHQPKKGRKGGLNMKWVWLMILAFMLGFMLPVTFGNMDSSGPYPDDNRKQGQRPCRTSPC